MATTHPSATTQHPTEHYRQGEREFWRHYGLEPSEHVITVGSPSSRLRVQEVGSGPPVIFVHGTGGSGAYFAPLIAQLDGVRCLVIDRPGWGLSEPIDFAGRDYAALVAGLLRDALDRLGVEQVDAVGGSIGNTWVLRLAQAHPARVKRLVWLGGFPRSELGVPPFIRLLASPLGRVIARLAEREPIMRKQLAGLGHDATVRSGAMDAYLHWRTAEARETHFLRHERAMIQAVLNRQGFADGVAVDDEELAGLRHPALLVHGTADPVGSTKLWQRTIDCLPHGTLHTVDGGGHLPWYDNPDDVGSAVNSFLTT